MTRSHHPQAAPFHLPFRRTAVACAALHLLGATVLTSVAVPMPAHAQTAAATRSYDISAGQLTAALNRFGRDAGIMLSFSTAMTDGLQTSGLQGSHEVAAGLQALLVGTGLQAVRQKNGGYVLQQGSESGAYETTLAPVTVSGVRDVTTEGSGSYGARGANIMKGAQSLKEIPQSVTVMTRQQMDDQGLDTLPEVLSQTPGITLVRRPNGGKDIYARGFLTETLQYDGIPLLRYHSFGNELSASSIHLDRIEVLRGAQGLLEGAGSPAGSVNLVRKRGLAERTVVIEGRVGSWNTYGTRLDVGGPLDESGTVRGRAVLDYEDADSFLDQVWDRNINGYAAIDFDISPATTVGVGITHGRLKGNSSLYEGVPRYTNGEAIPLPRSAYIGAGWNETLRRETQTFFDIEHRFNSNWTLKASAVHVRENFDAVRSFANGRVAVGGSSVDGTGFSYDNASTNKGMDIHLSGKLRALGLEHEAVIGANYSKQSRNDNYRQYWMHTSYDVFAPDHDGPPLSSYSPTDIWDQFSNTEQKGIYGLWRSHLTEHTTLLLGGRTSWYTFNSLGASRLSDYQSAVSRKESGKFVPYAGIVHALTPQWSAYASYAEIFNPQSETDAQRRVLPPTTGVAYEAGIKGELLDGALNASLAVFRVEQKNRAVTDYDSPQVCDGWYCSRASGKVRSEGFEVEAHGKVTNGWQVSGGYTYSRNKYLQDTDETLIGQPFDYLAPRHMLRVWSDYQLQGNLDRWRVGGGVNYRSEQRTSSTTMVNPVQGGYAIWNARVGYQIDKNWSAALNIDNLFDKRYYSFISNNYYYSYVGEPRRVQLTLRGTFK